MQQIPNFPGYFIDECGNIDSYKYTTVRRLKKRVDAGGYYYYRLMHSDNTQKSVRIHKLIASTYLTDSHLNVLHNDGDKANNCVDNLRYGTYSDNLVDSSKHGTHPTRVLTDDDVREVRLSTSSQRDLARQYGVSQPTISKVKNHIIFTHIN